MDYFWIIPLAIIALVAVWVFRTTVARSHKSGIRTTGRVLYDRPDPNKPDNPPPY